ncbi:MAG: MCE family protein [Abitibacteriaceae bacterium]|nr:MCE family protein [Abditibacteriaceae bacterium]MBV9864793.1 MCE family protein [Abditibacteriaceae bacterium]
MRAGNEVRVGVVVILALALMIAGYFYLRGIGLGANLYYLRLNGAANIAAGNDVRLQGVKIGQVHDVTLDPNTQKPLLTLAIRRDPRFKLMRNYTYSVLATSLIGENYVDIRGAYDPSATTYTANDPSQVIPGKAAAGITAITDQASNLVPKLSSTLDEFNKTLKGFNKTIQIVNTGVLSTQNQRSLTQALAGVDRLTRQVGQGFGPQGIKFSFGDPHSQRAFNQTLSNAALAAGEANIAAHNLNLLTRNANGVLNQNQAKLSALLTNLNQASRNAAGLTQSLNIVVRNGHLAENAQLTLNALRRAAENMEAGTSGLKAIGADPTTQANLKATVSNLQETTATLLATANSIRTVVADPATQGQLKGILTTLNTTASTLQSMTENLRDTTAGLKNVFGDPKFQDNIKNVPALLNSTLTEAQGTLTATRSTAERLNSLLGGRKKRNSTGQGGGSKAQQQGFAPGGFDFTYRHFTGARNGVNLGGNGRDRDFGDVNFNAELFGGPFRLGLANIGEGNDLTAQTGSFSGKNGAVRYGIYRSKLGVGADYHFGKFSLEGNLWDPNHGSANAYLGFQVTPRVEILAGREHIGGVHTNSIGVRLTP